MDKSIAAVIDDLKRASARCRAYDDAIEKLRKVSSLENHIMELESKRDDLITECESVDKQVAIATERAAELDDVSLKIEEHNKVIIADAKEDAKEIRSDARKKGKRRALELTKREESKLKYLVESVAGKEAEIRNLELKEQELTEKIKELSVKYVDLSNRYKRLANSVNELRNSLKL